MICARMSWLDEREETSDEEELVDVGEKRVESEGEEEAEPMIEEEVVEQDPYHMWFNKRSFTEEDKEKADTLLYSFCSALILDRPFRWSPSRLTTTSRANTLPTEKIPSRFLPPRSLRFESVCSPRRSRISLPFHRTLVSWLCTKRFLITATCCMRRTRNCLQQTPTTSSSSPLCVCTFSIT